MKVKIFGEIKPHAFELTLSRDEALDRLDFFLEHQLLYFGLYQDAMIERHPILFHSQLSFALNCKMLSPKEVIDKAIGYWQANHDVIGLAQIEGFIRQIMGWREFMRGVYWAKMPNYAKLNHFGHDRPLPKWFWTGETKMNCLSHSIGASLKLAYAHHIQRLMVIGNFALLAGLHPDEVDAWYLGVYIDAIEWVQLPNTRGMSQYADGGLVGSKPYVASANYIHKMSDYCGSCFYKKDEKIGAQACPFNSLYWHFYQVNSASLRKHPRVATMYRVWDKFDKRTQQALLAQARENLSRLDAL